MPFRLSPEAFGRTLQLIAAGPYRPELVTQLDLTQPGRHLVLTFDDGGKSALRAAEQLSQRGWRGHFFVVTSLIGRRTFLGRDEIRQLHGWGHTIGSHSHSHPNIFRELPRHRMLDEWRVSSAVLSDLLGAPCTTASVPGGEISGAVLASAAESGLGFLFTVEPQLRPRPVNGCWVLGRCLIKGRTPITRLDDLVHFRGWTRALALRQLKGLARRAFPLFYRRLVERRTREWPSSEEPMDPVESAR